MQEDLYAIGDLQGCFESIEGLLEQIPTDAHIVFVGDVVNRGPQSLATLRLVRDLVVSGRARMILGNHDLHLLAIAAGAGKQHKRDTLTDILEAPDRDELIDFLRKQPLIINDPQVVFAHAGIPPQWTLDLALKLAATAEADLRANDWKQRIQGMYGGGDYHPGLKGIELLRAIFNGLTRMRFIKPDGSLDFDIREGIAKMPEGYRPWFECQRLVGKTICFGHWSMLGLVLRPHLIAIDTGCLWGGTLTAIRLRDRRLFQEPCPDWADPC